MEKITEIIPENMKRTNERYCNCSYLSSKPILVTLSNFKSVPEHYFFILKGCKATAPKDKKDLPSV